MAISIARQFVATITGAYSINIQPHSEFRGIGSATKDLDKEIKKLMEQSKTLAAQNGIVFNEKLMHGDLVIISLN